MAHLTIKPGVDINGLQAVMWRAAADVAEVYEEFGLPCIITSALDGRHSAKSFHYVGLALDFRTHVIPKGTEQAVADRVVQKLGPKFDVILEALDTPNEHLHVEFDEK